MPKLTWFKCWPIAAVPFWPSQPSVLKGAGDAAESLALNLQDLPWYDMAGDARVTPYEF